MIFVSIATFRLSDDFELGEISVTVESEYQSVKRISCLPYDDARVY